jgi:hypothetical protein
VQLSVKKDIHIPVVSDVHVAIVREYNDTFKTNDWNAYIINNKTCDLEMVLIVTWGYSKQLKTSILRKKLDRLPAKSYAKIEFMQDDVLALNNCFDVTFFEGSVMCEKSYVFEKNSSEPKSFQHIPLMNIEGILRD